ncbi:MAG: histidine kinase [Flavobacterium sp.]|nr:histidine kinase [Flavobacterium sp.]
MNMYSGEMVNLLWGFISSGLIIFFLLCSLIYQQTKQRTFLYYSLYNLLLFIYLLRGCPFIPNDYLTAFYNSRFYSFYWFVQIVYNSLMFFFYIEFLELKKYFPRFTATLVYYLRILLFIASMMLSYAIITKTFLPYRYFFDYGFIPSITFFVVIAIYLTAKIPNKLKYFVISGVLSYQILAYIALMKTYSNDAKQEAFPILYFYIGIIIESIIFMLGLGYKIKLLYLEKINAQKKIIEEQHATQLLKERYQKELEAELDAKINELRIALKKTEAEKIKSVTLTFENEITNLKLASLRSHMNPHFIFNALNSIKAYFVDNEKEKAVFYLNKFSKLIRKILETSLVDSISLQEELEIIEIYMNIENIRFNGTIQFQINNTTETPLSDIRLPGLILQPFIENALWHGLMSKDGEKKILIEVFDNKKDVMLSISDNGIGRKKSKENRDKKSIKRESLGIQFANERLNYFNKNQHSKYTYKFIDLCDEANNSLGTVVIFTLKK